MNKRFPLQIAIAEAVSYHRDPDHVAIGLPGRRMIVVGGICHRRIIDRDIDRGRDRHEDVILVRPMIDIDIDHLGRRRIGPRIRLDTGEYWFLITGKQGYSVLKSPKTWY